MATEGGVKAIIDETAYHGEELAETLAKHKNNYDRACWVFLEKKSCWDVATAFSHADSPPVSY